MELKDSKQKDITPIKAEDLINHMLKLMESQYKIIKVNQVNINPKQLKDLVDKNLELYKDPHQDLHQDLFIMNQNQEKILRNISKRRDLIRIVTKGVVSIVIQQKKVEIRLQTMEMELLLLFLTKQKPNRAKKSQSKETSLSLKK